MTRAVANLTTLITLITLLFCNSIACAQADDSTKVETVEGKFEETTQTKVQANSTMPQAIPGGRVTNPEHLILNSDTTLGGVEIKGTSPKDFGYLGPGDMRTHLWNGHSKELIQNGITENKLMAMTVEEVQKWHNYFHGVEDSPEHLHDDVEQSSLHTNVQLPMVPESSSYVDDQVYGTIVYENSGSQNSDYFQSVDGQPEIIYEQGVIIQGSANFEYETQN